MRRALALGASGFALTGSTARRRRTAISDLDYHVIGERPDVSDLPGELDVVATSAARFRSRLIEGDDFIQWTLRCGCILYDAGVMRDGVQLIVERDLWPSAQRKLRARVFPLARKELPAQLEQAGYVPLANTLRRTTEREPRLDEIEAGLQILDASLEDLGTTLAA